MRKISRFYKTAIMQNLGLFIAMGLLNALFSEYGWFPNESIQEAITVLYAVVIPVFVAYACGKLSGEELGAAVSIIAMLGAVVEKNAYSIFIAMLVCPVIGFITNRLYRLIKEKIPSGFEMLVKNLLIGIVGVFFLLVVRMLAVAGISRVYDAIYGMANYFASHDMMGALSVIVEPLKVLFLNNSINYGILTPIGLEQMREFGKSLFFLVEANPGPGLGILLAFMCHYQEKRKKFATYALIESIGGIHEIYFPYVLTRPELILAAIAGGASGMAVFELAGAGMVGNVSPGSLIMFGILSAKGDMIWIFLGIIVSAVVSFGVASVILRWGKEKKVVMEQKEIEEKKKEKPKYIYFACDAGFGSSAMAASLFRRKLKKEGMEDICVEHTSIENIPPNADIVFAQKSFEKQMIHRQAQTTYYFLESVMQDPVFEKLICQWKEL